MNLNLFFQDEVMDTLLGIMENNSNQLMILSGISLAVFIVSLAAIPWIIGKMPAEYFIRRGKTREDLVNSPFGLGLIVLKNILGALLLAAGVVMLITPGQGLLTILLGLGVMDFPGKRRLESMLLGMKWVRDMLNRTRTKQGEMPFLFQCPCRPDPLKKI